MSCAPCSTPASGCDLASDALDTCGTGGSRAAAGGGVQRVDPRRARGRRRGRQGVQARQPAGVGHQQLGRPARSARRRHRPRARRRRPLRRRGRASGSAWRPASTRACATPGPCAASSAWPHRVQPARAPGQPGAGEAPGHRRGRRRRGREGGPRAAGQRHRAGHGGLRPRRPRRAHHRGTVDGGRAARRRDPLLRRRPRVARASRRCSRRPAGGDTAANVELVRRLLDGETGRPPRHRRAQRRRRRWWWPAWSTTLADGVELAAASVAEGKAAATLDRLVEVSQAAVEA